MTFDDTLAARVRDVPFDVTGRPMKRWLMVAGEVLDDDVLRAWVDRGVAFAGSLPPK